MNWIKLQLLNPRYILGTYALLGRALFELFAIKTIKETKKTIEPRSYVFFGANLRHHL